MKKNLLWGALVFASVLIGFPSCSSDDDNYIEPVNPVDSFAGVYALSSGAMGGNAGTISFYNFETKEVIADAFQKVNGEKLGDTGQDMIAYGNKIYLGVYGSQVIYVLDKNLKILKKIGDDANKYQTRSFEAYNGKVYVTLYDGYLARIDTTTMEIDKKIQVGRNPEGVKAVNNKLYVANSGGMTGYDNTVSVIDPDLTVKKDITVVTNPSVLKTDKYNNLFLVSWGNYENIPYSLQQINTTTDVVSELKQGVYNIFPDGNKLYLLNKQYDPVTYKPTSTITYYDISKKEFVNKSFITDGTTIADINTVAFNSTTGDIFVGAADGSNNGDVYIFSADGKKKTQFETGSAYPMTLLFTK